MGKTFTEEIIKHYLEDKLYERRGISKDEYIERCRNIWDQTKCEENGVKILIDGLYEYSNFDKKNDYNDKLLTNQLKNKKREDKIECVCLAFFKWEDGDLKQVSENEQTSNNLDDPLEPEERPYLFALFDVLGFEALHTELGTTKLYRVYKELIDKVTSKDRFSTFQTFNEPDVAWTMMGSMPLRHHYFSDTIILWTPLLPEFISPFCARCADIVCESILMGLPLRGAISSGSAILNKDKGVFLGAPIIEAARVENQQNWIGVSFCPSFTDPYFQLALHPDLLIQNYTTHFKTVNGFNKYISLMALDWPKRAREQKITEKIIKQLQSLKNNAPIDKQIYYINTLSFLQHSLNEDEWYKNYDLIIPEPLGTIIKVTLSNGAELEGVRPDFELKDKGFNQTNFMLVPKENIETVKNLIKERQTIQLDVLQKLVYIIPRKAIARIQLLRKPKPDHKLSQSVEPNDKVRNQVVKDAAILNKTISRVYVGAKGFDIFIPTLNEIHECARNLIIVNYAVPEGETWDKDGIETLHKIELFSHRDFISTVERFRNQAELNKETNDFMVNFVVDYKNICGTFVADIDGLLVNYDPNYKLEYAPSVMENERFRLLGLMMKMLCMLTQQ